MMKRLVIFVGILIGCCLIISCSETQQSTAPTEPPDIPATQLNDDGQLPDDGYYTKTVHYGTTRVDKCESADTYALKQSCYAHELERLDTGNELTLNETHYGRVLVKIPFTKERGSTKGMRLIDFEHDVGWGDFILKLTEDDLLVFVHGYNTHFSDAAIRCAQLAHDTNFEGEAVLFSWPSKSLLPVSGYKNDKHRANENFKHLADFLQKLADSTDKKIHIIAHSMGTYVLTNAMAILAKRPGGDRQMFAQVILAAPDIALDDYHQIFTKKVYELAERVTLYSAINDAVLMSSRLVNYFVEGTSQVRLGDSSKGFTVFEGMNTVDTRREVNLQLVGHSYYATYPSLVTDMHILLRYGTPPDGRILQKVADKNNNVLWFILDDREVLP